MFDHSHPQQIDRRCLMLLSVGAAGSAIIPGFRNAALGVAASQREPHFFLQIIFPGGLDPTYTFDARPESFVEAKKHANYLRGERVMRQSPNGNKNLETSLVKALSPFRDRFSVINGVMMMPQFDGHDNNMDFLLTGDGFGGESQLPHLNTVGSPTPLDYVQLGGVVPATAFTNAANGVPLDPEATKNFVERLARMHQFAQGGPAQSFLQARMDAAGRGRGRFSAGSRAMSEAFSKMSKLAQALREINIAARPQPTSTPAQQRGVDVLGSIQLIGELFKHNVCRSALFVLSESALDNHGFDNAQSMPTIIPKLMMQLAQMIGHLANTAYDDQRSLLDVTTFVVSTEFGRTLRQTFPAFDKSGTDHNSLTNTVLVGGKGVRGGLVIGASDFEALDEKLSRAHLIQDPERIKMMGRPFDFAIGTSAMAAPEEFREEDYLTYSSIANTINSLFGVPDSLNRLTRRNGPKAPILRSLLT